MGIFVTFFFMTDVFDVLLFANCIHNVSSEMCQKFMKCL